MATNTLTDMKEPLWSPSDERIKNANITHFIEFVNHRYGKQFYNYNQLYKWSIKNISDFWGSIWECGEVKASSGYETVVDDLGKMPGAKWFMRAKLNFAENLLGYRDDQIALIFKGEHRKEPKMTGGTDTSAAVAYTTSQNHYSLQRTI